MKEEGFLRLWLLLCCMTGTHALLCYWCSGVGGDRECERRPFAVTSGPLYVNCHASFCITAKVTDAKTGEVKSFARLCDNIPKGNQCVQDSKLVTCYESCTRDFCNGGNPGPHYLRTINYANDNDNDAGKSKIVEGDDMVGAMGANMMSVYRYNNLEASRGFQEPMMEEDGNPGGNMVSPYKSLPENIQRIIQDHRQNLAYSAGSPKADRTNVARDAGDENDEETEDEDEDSRTIVAYRGLTDDESANAEAEKPAHARSTTRTIQNEDDLSLDDRVEASGSQPASLISTFSSNFVKHPVAKSVATTGESTDQENYLHAGDAEFRSEKEAKKNKLDTVEELVGMVMSHHPSYYISSSANSDKQSKDWKDEESTGDDVTSTSTKNPSKTDVGPPSSGLTSVPSTNYTHTPSPQPSFASKREKTTVVDITPQISKFMSTGLHTDTAREHSPRRRFMPAAASKIPSNRFGSFFKHPTNPSTQFFAERRPSARSPFAGRRLRLPFSPGPQGSRSVAPQFYSTRRHSPPRAPVNPSASILPPVSSYLYPMNPGNAAVTTLGLKAGGFSARSPAYLYPSLPVVADQPSFRRVHSPAVLNRTLSLMVTPDFPQPDPYSGLSRNHNRIHLHRDDTPFPGHTRSAEGLRAGFPRNDVVGRVRDLSGHVGPELEYLLQTSNFTDGPGGELTNDYEAAFVESGYVRDSFDSLVTAFRQHPENRYPLAEQEADTHAEPEKENGSSESQGETQESTKPRIIREQSGENDTYVHAMNKGKDAGQEHSPGSSNETQSSKDTDKREPIVVWSRSQPTSKSTFSDKQQKTTLTYGTINRSVVITDSPLTIKSHSQKERAKSLDSRRNEFRQLSKTNRRGDIGKTANEPGKRRKIKTTFKDNLSNDRGLKLVETVSPSSKRLSKAIETKTTLSSAGKSHRITVTKASDVGIVQTTVLSRKAIESTSSELNSSTIGTKVDDVTKTTVTARLDDVRAATASNPKSVSSSSAAAATAVVTRPYSEMLGHQNRTATSQNTDRFLGKPKGENSVSHTYTAEAGLSSTVEFPSTQALTSPQIPTTPSTNSLGSPSGTPAIQTAFLSSSKSWVQNSVENPTTASEESTSYGEMINKSTKGHRSDDGKNRRMSAVHTNANDRLPNFRREDQTHVTPSAAEWNKYSSRNSTSTPAGTLKWTRSYVIEGTTKMSTPSNPVFGKNSSEQTKTTARTPTTYSSPQQQQAVHPKMAYPKTTQIVKFPSLRAKSATVGSTRKIPPHMNRYQAPRLQLRKSSSNLLTLKSEDPQVMDSFGHVHEEEDPESNGGQNLLCCRSVFALWMMTIVYMYFPVLYT